MLRSETYTISPTQITQVVYAEPYPSPNPQSASMGKHQHSRIGGLLKRGIETTLPGFKERSLLDLGGPVQTEKSVQKWVGESLLLRATLDVLIGKGFVVEIKPHVRQTHLMQLMFNCLAASNGVPAEGALYSYVGQEKAYLLDRGGQDFWPTGVTLCTLAHTILNCQAQIDSLKHQRKLSKRSINGQHTFDSMRPDGDDYGQVSRLAEQAMDARADFDPLFRTTAAALTQTIHPIRV